MAVHIIAEEDNGQPVGPVCEMGLGSGEYIIPEPTEGQIKQLGCIECVSDARHSNRAIGNYRTFRRLDKRWKELLEARNAAA